MARGSLRIDSARALAEHRTGDVAMQPRRVSDELLEEKRGADRPAVTLAGVLQIGDVALELLAQVLEQRHPPKLLAGQRRSVLEALRRAIVFDVKRRARLAERHEARAR